MTYTYSWTTQQHPQVSAESVLPVVEIGLMKNDRILKIHPTGGMCSKGKS